jgi:hypothetical protein
MPAVQGTFNHFNTLLSRVTVISSFFVRALSRKIPFQGIYTRVNLNVGKNPE